MTKRPKSKKTRRLSLVIRAAVATIALIWVCRGQDWGELRKILASLNLWYFALSLLVYAFAQVLIGLRWWVLLRAQSIKTNIAAAVRLHFLGLFYNHVMPGSVGGDLLRAWYVTKHTDKKLEAALSVFVDRVIGLSGMLAIAIFSYVVFMRGKGALAVSGRKSSLSGFISSNSHLILLILLGLAALVCGLLLHKSGRSLLRKARDYFCTHGLRMAHKIKQAIIIYCSKPLTIMLAFGLTILVQTLVITAFWLLGRNLQITAGARYYFVFFPLTWVLAALPISIAGIGILEGGIRELFTRFAGAAVERTLALGFCQRFVWVLASLPGALIHLLGAHLPKDFFIDSQERVN